MMTVKQVSSLTGISVRTLQFYDEIGLFKPTKITDAGYRLYDDSSLETLQQILFFKELDFTLKEIKTIMQNPLFDKAGAFQKQRELIQMKRDRLNALLKILDKLIKGEKCMDFKDFDLHEYFQALTELKKTHTEEIVKHFGSMEQFDEMIGNMQSHESEIADSALKQYGSIENYTRAMEKNLQSFLVNGSKIHQSEASDLIAKTEVITKKLTADLNRDVASPEIKKIVQELISFTNKCNDGIDMGENYWSYMAENYVSNPLFIETTDQKYGDGASLFIGLALKSYLARE